MIPLSDQIAEVEREVRARRKQYADLNPLSGYSALDRRRDHG